MFQHLRCLLLLPALLLALGGKAAHAEDFELPGIQGQVDTYLEGLTARFPTGAPAAARRTAEQQAATAIAKRDW